MGMALVSTRWGAALLLSLAGWSAGAPSRGRGRFLFKHVAKTGGQAIVSKLKAEYGQLFEEGLFTVRAERDTVTREEAREAFIVSSARNPCALYVSLWAWGVMGHGRYNFEFKKMHKSEPMMAHVYDTVSNVSSFRLFARGSLGEFSRRYHDYLDTEAVDCWVHTETMDADLQACLEQFVSQAPTEVAARLQEADLRANDGREGGRENRPDGSHSGGGGGDQRPELRNVTELAIKHSYAGPSSPDDGSHSLRAAPALSIADYNLHQSEHAPCEFYFRGDPDLVQLIAKVRQDAPLHRQNAHYITKA